MPKFCHRVLSNSKTNDIKCLSLQNLKLFFPWKDCFNIMQKALSEAYYSNIMFEPITCSIPSYILMLEDRKLYNF